MFHFKALNHIYGYVAVILRKTNSNRPNDVITFEKLWQYYNVVSFWRKKNIGLTNTTCIDLS